MEEGPSAGEEFGFSDRVITIGREESAEINFRVQSPTISRRHARITRVGDGWQVEDLKSSNGTFLNGQKIGQSPRLISSGDHLQLGGTIQFIIHFVERSEALERSKPIAATVMAEEIDYPTATAPPQLIVTVAGTDPSTYELTKSNITLGRSPENDIVIGSKIVSRHHARLEAAFGGFKLVVDERASNPVLFEGKPLDRAQQLNHGDVLRIGSLDPGLMVTMAYLSPAETEQITDTLKVKFGDKNLLQFGRDPSNDVVLDSPTVSRFHAQIERIGQRYRINDLRSSNATFVNEEGIEGETWLQPSDTIRIGPYRFVMGQDELAQFDESGGLRADAINLNKWVRKDLNILQNISVAFKPREFIVIVGQSGGGKTTLLDAIAGYRPASHGTVFVNDVDVYKNFDAVRNNIGYVPQKDIIHMELTVYQALDYAARLRMPADTSRDERHSRIVEVLDDLDLTHRKDVQVSGLSGGQQKRVSIGVELLTKPGLFFLDEATSGLDPGTETSLMQLLRRLADQGRTIVLVTHATKNVMLADKVVFLARGGYLSWFGPPDEALAYFNQYRPERDRRTREMEFDAIYTILENPDLGTPEVWADRFKKHPSYKTYVESPIVEKQADFVKAQESRPSRKAKRAAKREKSQVSSLRQFFILSSRHLKILTRDRVSMILMLGAAPLVSLLDVLIATVSGGNPYDFTDGNFGDIMQSFFLLLIFAVFVGGLSQMREIVKENDIYKRERLVNLKIFPYVFSKIWVAAIVALYHSLVYVGIHYLVYEMPGGVTEFLLLYISMAFLVLSGMMLGLFASALSPNANSVPMLVIIFIMPNIVLSGAMVPLPTTITAPASTRWALEGWISTTGIGSDLAEDICYDLPEDVRKTMSVEDATARCNCMGTNVVKEDLCFFPGIGKYYVDEIDQPEPIEPDPLRERPADPQLPPEPEQPSDQSDSVAMAQYAESMQVWRDEAELIQDGYRAEMEAYERDADLYRAEMENYQTEYSTWKSKREGLVDQAVKALAAIDEEYNWAFVNKDDTQAYWSKIVTSWLAQGIIIAILILGVLWMVRRKDVV
jgi:ABC-type multidrug transport system ATPase subunit/predicted component of type VI protein secretion system